MQVIIGGAFNGKGHYVRTLLANKEAYYFDGEMPTKGMSKDAYIVIGNFDKLLAPLQELGEVAAANEIFTQLCQLDEEAHVICICTDMSRGIVPLDAKMRFVRDACGRLYQLLFQQSTKVTRIWYGLAETLKEEQ
ncbi:MAG: hypothetical protein ABS951_13895 [Solibacillus sp.]